MPPTPSDGARIFVLSGAGLSAASGVPTFRDGDGLWEGHRFEDVATPQAWHHDPEMVRRFYDERRISCANVMPNPAHLALARLQHWWGPNRVTLVTQNIDGLLTKAGAPEVIEMHGSIWHLRCEDDPDHPVVQVAGPQNRDQVCGLCGRPMRPNVVWFGEVPLHMDRIEPLLRQCDIFLSIGTSGVVYPAAGFTQVARAGGAHCIEINPRPTPGRFDEVLTEPAELAVPRIVGAWVGEEATDEVPLDG